MESHSGPPDAYCDGPDAARYRGFLAASWSAQADSLRASQPDVQVDLYLREIRCGNLPTNDALSEVLVKNRDAVTPALERRFAAPKDEWERAEIARILHGFRMKRSDVLDQAPARERNRPTAPAAR